MLGSLRMTKYALEVRPIKTDSNILPVPGSREAYELASDIMGIALEDFDLYLSEDKSTYEYHEDPPKIKRTKDGPAR